MSRQDLVDPRGRLEMPSRRRALFDARDLALAAVATPVLPALVGPAAAALPAVPFNVAHGFADLQGITLWLQGAATQSVRVEIRAEQGSGPALQTHRVALDPREDWTAALRLDGLEAGTAHRYTVHPGDRKEVLASGAFRTQVHWQYRSDPPTVRIAAGSCNYLNDGKYDRPGAPYGGGEGIFDVIAGASPDLMLWLGDNIYLRDPEWTSRAGINRRYRFYRSHPAMRKLWQSTPHVAIWDDHDLGPDDGDASFSNRPWALEMFRRYWPMPFATPADGLYGQMTQGDVDIFLLDGRSYRYPNRWPDEPQKALYGPAQLQWLKAALVYSRAPFKLVCGGSQFLNKAAGTRRECWTSRYPGEYQAFRRWIDDAKIPGVIFLSGDRHFAQLLRVERPGQYPLHELTTSPLTSGPVTDPGDLERNNSDMVAGTMYNDRNFAMITVSGPRLMRSIAIELMDSGGAKKWEWRATAAELAAGTRT